MKKGRQARAEKQSILNLLSSHELAFRDVTLKDWYIQLIVFIYFTLSMNIIGWGMARSNFYGGKCSQNWVSDLRKKWDFKVWIGRNPWTTPSEPRFYFIIFRKGVVKFQIVPPLKHSSAFNSFVMLPRWKFHGGHN